MVARTSSSTSLKSLAGHGTLTPLIAHLSLAVAANKHLLISVPSDASLAALCLAITQFCNHTNIQRSCRCIVQPDAQAAYDLKATDLLASIFEARPEKNDSVGNFLATNPLPAQQRSSGKIPSVLVLSNLEDHIASAQITLKDALRDKRFEVEGGVYTLPHNFILIGLVRISEHDNMDGQLIDHFGLSMRLESSFAFADQMYVPLLASTNRSLHIAPPLRVYAADLLSALRNHPMINGMLLTYRCPPNYILTIAQIWAQLKAQLYADNDSAATEVQDLWPKDVRDVFASCVLHRLRVRLPQEQLAAFWTSQEEIQAAMKTVQEKTKDDIAFALKLEQLADEVVQTA